MHIPFVVLQQLRIPFCMYSCSVSHMKVSVPLEVIIWWKTPHSVTKSSVLEACNQSESKIWYTASSLSC